MLSRARLFATPWTAIHQVPLSMRFSRQGYWSGLPFPSPGDLPNPGIELRSPTLQADSLPSEPPGKSCNENALLQRVFVFTSARHLRALPVWDHLFKVCYFLDNSMDCGLPGSCVLGILQARVLEWVSMPSSRGSSQPRDRTQISLIEGRFFTSEPPGKSHLSSSLP